jgi:NAD(P)-dependent dehydrogenase (short-subunit alcohol dehydrogenase family)
MGTTVKTVVIGATGLIGSQLIQLLNSRRGTSAHEVLGVTRRTQPGIDLEDPASIESFFDQLGPIHHVVVTAGAASFGRFAELDADAFALGLRSKLMGQVNVAMTALRRLPPGGSVTLTSGELSHTPIPGSAAVALVNGAIDSFVRAIALDAPAERRINAVSPGWIKETMVRMGLDPTEGTSARDVARLYLEALDGDAHGRILAAPRGRGES